MAIAENGHSRVQEKKAANWLYLSIGAAVIVACILIFAIEGKVKNPFESKAGREAPAQVH